MVTTLNTKSIGRGAQAALFALALLSSAVSARAQSPAGDTFRINAYHPGYQNHSAVAVDDRGNEVYVWEGDQDGSARGILGRRFGPGGESLGAEFQVNSYTTGNQVWPKAGFDARGGLVVVWGGVQGVFGRRFDASGAAAGAEFQVNQSPFGGSQGVPSLAMAPSGGFIVAWDGNDGSLTGLFGRRFDAAGTPLGPEFQINTYSTNIQHSPSVAITGDDGRFVVVYQSQDQDGWGARGQGFSPSGERVGAEFLVNAYYTGAQRIPAIARGGSDGTFVAVWYGTTPLDGSGTGVVARRFAGPGQPVGAEFLVNESTAGFQLVRGQSVSSDENGDFVVAWSNNNYVESPMRAPVYVRRFDASGAPRSGQFRVSSPFTGNTYGSYHLASDSSGNFIVSWAANLDSYAQRYGGLLPVLSDVDPTPSASSDGNGVLEAGETVVVAPLWRNLSGGQQTFGGAAATFGGPAGATYTLVDASADYGTVIHGLGASCTTIGNCYSARVSAPAPRPVQHWDAVLREDILPEAQGQSKRWRVHVGESFGDVPRGNPFYRFTETLLHAGVTAGCSATAYCPASPATREQMAVFVLISKEGMGYAPPACAPPNRFSDVPDTSPFCRFVEELVDRGVVTGCGPNLFCPTNSVTREQMAVFVLRTADPALVPAPCAPGTESFADVPASSPFCPWIEELARRGVVTGCGGGNYCPTSAVTRDQMSVFLTVTFGLALYGA